MKSIMYLFSLVLLSSMTFKNNVSPGDPLAGVEVKLWSTSKGIIATSVSDRNGMVEFKNIPEGTGYYLEYRFGIKERGIKGSEQPIRVEGIECKYPTGTVNTATNRAQSEPKVMTKKVGDIEITVTVTGNTIRGPISTSRSNIKQ
jgi:hypothetical protein